MLDRDLEKLKFETNVHHKQNLRSAIDPNLIDQLDISEIPSNNYKNAYKSLYQDELEKSVNLHEKKKNIERVKDMYDTRIDKSHFEKFNGMVGNEGTLKNSNTGLFVKNLNYRDVTYEDYDLNKQTKAL